MRTIGVVTTGGDAPGMNAAIRGVVRLASAKKIRVLGFKHGWEGLITNSHAILTARSVSGILQQGGTILHTSRCPQFEKKNGIVRAAKTLTQNHVEGLIVIGGNGSIRAAQEFSSYTDAHIICIPASIDNDVFGTEETIGFDTAVNTAIVEVDKIRDTAVSLDRIFMIEVMGRERGFIALDVGLTVGAEIILLPEVKYRKQDIFHTINENRAKGKRSGLIVAAEGIGDTRALAGEIQRNTRSEVRLSVLGYAQRGGNPTFRSRLLASLFANEAVELLWKKEGNRVVALQRDRVTSLPMSQSSSKEKPLDSNLVSLAKLLAT